MFRLALKSVRHNPKRLILTAIAVALGVALVTSIFTFTNAFGSGFNQLFRDIYAGIDVVVEPDPDAEVQIDPLSKEGALSVEAVEAMRQVDGVAVAEGGIGYEMGALLNKEGDAPITQGAPTIIFNWTGNEGIDGVTLIDGTAPASDGEIVLDVDTFDKLGVGLGDTAQIATEAGIEDVTITGTIRFGENNNTQTAAIILATEDTVRHLGGGLTGYRSASIVVEDGADPDTVAAAVDELVPDSMRALSSQAKLQEQTDALNEALDLVNVFALVFGLIALFVGSYIIVNTFRIIVTQRTREFGLLRAIGAQGSQIRTMILLEALVVGIVASTIGVGLGWLLALAGTALAELGAGDLFGAVVLPFDAIFWSYVLGISVTLVAALLPAIHASTISPMEALREAGTAGKKSLRVRNIVGGALTLLGIAAIVIGLYVTVPRPYIWVGVGAVFNVLGVTLLAAQVLVPMAFGLRGLLTRMWGVTGKLAANNIRREPRRSANTAAALMIGVMLLALVATFAASVKDTFQSQFATNQSELFVIGQTGPIPQGAVDVIESTPGVRDAVRYSWIEATFDGTPTQVGVIDADGAEGVFDFNVDRSLNEINGGVFIDPTIVELGYDVGDEVTLEGPNGPATFTVTGLYLNEGDQQFLVDWEQGLALSDDQFILQALVDFDDDADVEATTEAVTENLKADYPLVMVQSPDQLEQFFNQALDMLLGVITALLSAALTVAILGVANTLLLSVTERTREIGLLRAVGVKRGSVWAMITLESVVMAVFGTLLGIILGVGLGAAVVSALGEYGFERAVVPWMWIGIYTVLSMLAGVLAAVWPAYRASRLDILKAIAADG